MTVPGARETGRASRASVSSAGAESDREQLEAVQQLDHLRSARARAGPRPRRSGSASRRPTGTPLRSPRPPTAATATATTSGMLRLPTEQHRIVARFGERERVAEQPQVGHALQQRAGRDEQQRRPDTDHHERDRGGGVRVRRPERDETERGHERAGGRGGPERSSRPTSTMDADAPTSAPAPYIVFSQPASAPLPPRTSIAMTT